MPGQAVLLLSFAGLLSFCAGCTSRIREEYVPSPDRSQQALEAALRAWQEGRPTGTLQQGPPMLCVVDSHRRTGQVLTRYKILGETPGDGPRCIAVRLFLDNPDEIQTARYVLVGIDPLWVLRQEDYEMINHWECREPPVSASGGSQARVTKP